MEVRPPARHSIQRLVGIAVSRVRWPAAWRCALVTAATPKAPAAANSTNGRTSGGGCAVGGCGCSAGPHVTAGAWYAQLNH